MSSLHFERLYSVCRRVVAQWRQHLQNLRTFTEIPIAFHHAVLVFQLLHCYYCPSPLWNHKPGSPTPHRKAPAGSARCVLPTAPKSQPQGWCEMKGTACCLSCYSPEWEANTLFAMWNVFTCPKTSRSSTLHLFCATVISILDEGTGITLIWELRIAM